MKNINRTICVCKLRKTISTILLKYGQNMDITNKVSESSEMFKDFSVPVIHTK